MTVATQCSSRGISTQCSSCGTETDVLIGTRCNDCVYVPPRWVWNEDEHLFNRPYDSEDSEDRDEDDERPRCGACGNMSFDVRGARVLRESVYQQVVTATGEIDESYLWVNDDDWDVSDADSDSVTDISINCHSCGEVYRGPWDYC